MPPLNRFQKNCIALAVGNAVLAVPVSAATITVGGNCDLVDAIASANTDLAVNTCNAGEVGADTIVLPLNHVATYTTAGYSYTTALLGLQVDSALPTIESDITIQGTGAVNAIIERSTIGVVPDFRLIAVASGAHLTLDAVTIRGGKLSTPGASGAGIYAYEASLSLNNSTVSGNIADAAAGIDLQSCGFFAMDNSTVSNNSASNAGGGIFASYLATMSIINSTISANSAGTFAGGIGVIGDALSMVDISQSQIMANTANPGSIDGLGGGIYALDVALTIDNVTVLNNSARSGAGLHIDGSTLVFEKSTLAQNMAIESGAGALLSDTDIEIVKSTISENSATEQGGGIHHSGAANSSFKMRESTLSGNVAASGSALHLDVATNEIRNSTIYDNSTSVPGPVAASVVSTALPGMLVNTIIAGSNNTGCYFGVGMPIIANASSWFEDTSCDGVGQGSPLLNPLMDNNLGLPNPTLTHAPSLSSGVLGIGDTGTCALNGGTDQRGAARGVFTCDIGAVEGSFSGAFDDACFVIKASNGNGINFCL